MAAIRRLMLELKDFKASGAKWLKDVKVQKDDWYHWVVTIKPDSFPYELACYRILLNFPREYPFKPPKMYFETPIYHPNVDAKGITKLPILTALKWRPRTTPLEVFQSLIELLREPDLIDPMREDLANTYKNSKYKYFKNAFKNTKRHGDYCD